MFDTYLTKTGEVGVVTGIFHSIIEVEGLPSVHLNEVVVFENGGIGQVFSLLFDRIEVLLLKSNEVYVGLKLVATGKGLEVKVSDSLLGQTVDSLGKVVGADREIDNKLSKNFLIDFKPLGILGRRPVTDFFETGVSLVDLIVPLGKGQRELVIGDRKTGKTEFLLQTVMSHAKNGGVCVYGIIGQRQIDILKRREFLESKQVSSKCVIVASNSNDYPGFIFLTPYVACTIAEYFASKGLDVLLILDDMTSHARYYREISLLSRRFPGKGSYPGDIFYAQAKVIERAGNFTKGSITCLPVAESVAGDLSGFIQTNLMAMTDGHLYFDSDLYNQGKRPSVNPLLSVTRVGHQTQTPLMRDISRVLSNFIVSYEKMKAFKHFGAEAGEIVKDVLENGHKLDDFLNQQEYKIIPINLNILIIGGIWANVTDNINYNSLFNKYLEDQVFKKKVDDLILASKNFEKLVRSIKEDETYIVDK